MTVRNRVIVLSLLFTLFWLIPVDMLHAQCSMCRAVVESNQAGKGQSLNNGILYLMGFPYIIIMALGVILFRKLYKDNDRFRKGSLSAT